MIAAIIVAGGMGKRLGADVPKAFISLAGKELFIHSFLVFNLHPSISEIVVVVPAGYEDDALNIISKYANISKKLKVVCGGVERWNSVQNGILATTENIEKVLIHDAARPFVTTSVVNGVLEKSEEYNAVISATYTFDTMRKFSGELCAETVDRSELLKVGTPQVFQKKLLLDGMNKTEEWDNTPTDEAMIMERIGIPIAYSIGNPINFKITTQSDRELAEAFAAYKKMRCKKNEYQ